MKNGTDEVLMIKTKNSLVFDMIKDLVLGVLGGMCIAIGGTAFIASGGGIIGALMFVVGLFIILTFNFNLFTGKICYVLDKDKKFWLTILFTYLGNIIGAVLVGYLLHVTRLFSTETIMSFAEGVAQTKLQDSPLSLFVLAIFCNILIYVAVEGFNNCKNQIGKYLSLFFGVSVFVLCGFEHCIADMFYFSFAGVWSWKAVSYILIITAGNMVGGLLIPVIKKLLTKKETTIAVAEISGQDDEKSDDTN